MGKVEFGFWAILVATVLWMCYKVLDIWAWVLWGIV